MKKLILIALALLSAGLTGCKQGKEANAGFEMFDGAAAIDNRRAFDLGEIAEKVEFVPLDDSAEGSLLGEVYMIAESRDGFYVAQGFESGAQPVKKFDRSGRFVGSVGGIGRGPEEYADVTYIAADRTTGLLYVTTGENAVMVYDAENQFVGRNDSMPDPQLACLDGEVVAMRYPADSSNPPHDGRRRLVDVYSSDLKLQRSFDAADHGAIPISMGFQSVGFQLLSGNDTEVVLREDLCDTLFAYRAGAFEPIGRLNMGRYAFPIEMYDFGQMTRWNEFYRPVSMLRGNRHIFVAVQQGLMGDISQLVFSRNGKSSDAAGAISAGFLATGPDGTAGLFIDGVAVTPHAMSGDRLLCLMRPIDLIGRRDQLTRPDLKDLADSITEESNPIVVLAKLR